MDPTTLRLMQGASGADNGATDIAVVGATTPRVEAYEWTNTGGFGTKYSNPASLPTGSGRGVAFSPSGNDLAVAHDTSPYISVYPWSSSGFGTKYSNPSSLPAGNGNDVAWHPSGNDIAVAHTTSPYLFIAPFTSGVGFGTPYSTAISGYGNQITLAFNPNGDKLVVAGGGAPYWLRCYNYTEGSGRGGNLTDVNTTEGNFNDVAFSHDGTHFVGCHYSTPFVTAYAFNAPSSPWYTRVSNPASLPPNHGWGATFSPDDSVIVAGHFNTPFMSAYAWTGTSWGTKYSNPSSLPANYSRPKFTEDGSALIAATASNPYLEAWAWDNTSGWGTKYSNPSSIPAGGVFNVSLRPIS